MYEYKWKSTINNFTHVYFKRSKRRILERNNNRNERSFRRGESRFVPKRKSRYQFRTRQKDAEDTTTTTSAPPAAGEATAARRRFTPSSRNKSKYRLNINTKVTNTGGTCHMENVYYSQPLSSVTSVSPEPAATSIRPTPSVARLEEPGRGEGSLLTLDTFPLVISSIDGDHAGEDTQYNVVHFSTAAELLRVENYI